MKISPRISVPLGIAFGVALLIGGLLLWQIQASISTIESAFPERDNRGRLSKILPGAQDKNSYRVSQSEALIALRQGEIFELKGEWKQAEEKYRTSAESGGGVPALRKLASIQLQRREYQEAKKTLSTLMEDNATSEDVMLLEGLLALRTGHSKEAMTIFQKSGETAQGLYGQSIVLITSGDHEEAKKILARAAESTDTTIRSYAKIILDAYTQFALFPDGEEIHRDTLIARALAEVNECETSLKLSTSAVSKQSRYRDAWIVKGYCEFRSERLKDALTSLEQAYSLDPEKAETQYFLSRTHAALGDPQNAVTYLQYALLNGFKPEKDARELLAEYAKELGNTELALEQLKIIAEADGSDIAAYERFVLLAIASPNHELDALALAKSAVSRWPNDAAALGLAAKAALAAGVPEDAEKYANSALKIDPKNPQALEVSEAMRK